MQVHICSHMSGIKLLVFFLVVFGLFFLPGVVCLEISNSAVVAAV